jgi:hypothetical protein
VTFFVDVPDAADAEDLRARLAAYTEYLERNKSLFPGSAYAFASAEWHYNPGDHRCPHDAWVEEVTIHEKGSGRRQEARELALSVRLLGAYHDGIILLKYLGVSAYSLTRTLSATGTGSSHSGHGDWLTDEVTIGTSGNLLHDVVFSRGGRWRIECADIEYEWSPVTRQMTH